MMPPQIELAELTRGEVRTLSGQERGVEARQRFDLDALDANGEIVTVQIPGDLDAVTPSFVQGMFSKSIRAFQTREAFLAHYQFVAGPRILRQIDVGIRHALMNRDHLLA